MSVISHTTKAAFEVAFFRKVQSFWPHVTREETDKWLYEYLEIPFGTHGHSWSVSAAIETAEAYVSESM